MDNKIIKTLKEKGVDPGIILDLILEDETAAPESAPEVAAQPAAPEVAAPEPITQKDVDQGKETSDAILAAIEKLTGAIQASNIIHTGTNKVPQETSADALAQLINPKGGI